MPPKDTHLLKKNYFSATTLLWKSPCLRPKSVLRRGSGGAGKPAAAWNSPAASSRASRKCRVARFCFFLKSAPSQPPLSTPCSLSGALASGSGPPLPQHLRRVCGSEWETDSKPATGSLNWAERTGRDSQPQTLTNVTATARSLFLWTLDPRVGCIRLKRCKTETDRRKLFAGYFVEEACLPAPYRKRVPAQDKHAGGRTTLGTTSGLSDPSLLTRPLRTTSQWVSSALGQLPGPPTSGQVPFGVLPLKTLLRLPSRNLFLSFFPPVFIGFCWGQDFSVCRWNGRGVFFHEE